MDADTLNKMANLPWTLQIVLGSGYLAYLLAYVGIRQNHKPVDAVFLSIAFGMVAAVAIWLSPALVLPARMAVALIATLIAAMLWRKLGRSALRHILRTTGYSWADDTVSAMDHLQENNRHHPRQLCVETTDGYTYYCSNTEPVGDLPYGPYILGGSGDVLMYADQSQAPTAEVPTVVEGVFDDEWGANITYIPANQVRRIAIRFASPISAVVAVGWKARARASVARMLRRLAMAVQPGG